MACLCLVLNHIPLSGCTMVNVAIHLLKDSAVDSKCWQLWIKLLYPSICRLLCEHNFHFSRVNTKECNCWMVSWEYIWFSRKLPGCLPKGLHHFVFPPAMMGSTCCSTSLPTCAVVSVLDLGRSLASAWILKQGEFRTSEQEFPPWLSGSESD